MLLYLTEDATTSDGTVVRTKGTWVTEAQLLVCHLQHGIAQFKASLEGVPLTLSFEVDSEPTKEEGWTTLGLLVFIIVFGFLGLMILKAIS